MEIGNYDIKVEGKVKIKVKGEERFIVDQEKVKNILLFEILKTLKEINNKIIYVEN